MLINLKGLFSPQAVAAYLKSLPPVKSTIMDLLFPERPTHPFALVGVEELVEVVGTIPVVTRGGKSINIGTGSASIMFVEPLPVKPSKSVTGQDLNNLKLLLGDKASLNNYGRNTTDYLRKTVRATTEGICSTVLTGKISWPVKLEGGGWEVYEVDYGTPLNAVPKKKIDESGATLSDLESILDDMETAIQEAGIGSNVEFIAGKKAWTYISGLVENLKSTAKIKVERTDKKLNINGYLISKCTERYRNPQTQKMVSKIPPHKILAYATDAPGKVMYCALDNIDSGLKPLPFQPVPYQLDEGTGYKIVGHSKPLPVRNPKTLCWAEVTEPET